MSIAETITEDEPAPAPAAVAMLQLIGGFYISRALFVTAKLGIADLLRYGPKDSEELAEATATHGPSLKRMLRALGSIGVFAEDEEERFSLTPLGHMLETDRPDSLGDLAILALGEESYWGWGNLMHSIRTGETAFDRIYDMSMWDYLGRHPESARNFDRAMSNLVGVYHSAVLAAYPFASFSKIIDVGGGDGSLLIALLKAAPNLRGMVFDLPHAADTARQRLARAGLASRCEVVAGDMFASVPHGGDAYLLSGVIHDWDDGRAATILENCRRAMQPPCKLLILEPVLPAKPDGSAKARSALLSDLNMMAMTGGRERTAAEYHALLRHSGFKQMRIIETQLAKCVIEALPA
jgi:SAM-dependent methyltransferase